MKTIKECLEFTNGYNKKYNKSTIIIGFFNGGGSDFNVYDFDPEEQTLEQRLTIFSDLYYAYFPIMFVDKTGKIIPLNELDGAEKA